MLTLNKEDLLNFQKRTQHMRKNTLLPILAYLRLDLREGRHWLTKSNAQAVCVAPVRGEASPAYTTILIDERILYAVLPTIKGEVIQVQLSDKQVRLSDGEKMVIDFAREDPTNFPITPVVGSAAEQLVLSADHLTAIDIAKNFLLDSETGGNHRFVHIGGESIRAYHNSYFYMNANFENLPSVLLGLEEAEVISECSIGSTLSNLDRHVHVQDGEIQYIFTKQEGNSPATKSMLEKLKLPGKSFEISRDDLSDFCSLANAVSETPLAFCSLEPNGGMFAKLRMLDANYNRNASKEVMAVGEFDQFNFNSRLIAGPLRAIPYTQLRAKTNSNTLIISNESGTEFFAFLGMQKQ